MLGCTPPQNPRRPQPLEPFETTPVCFNIAFKVIKKLCLHSRAIKVTTALFTLWESGNFAMEEAIKSKQSEPPVNPFITDISTLWQDEQRLGQSRWFGRLYSATRHDWNSAITNHAHHPTRPLVWDTPLSVRHTAPPPQTRINK